MLRQVFFPKAWNKSSARIQLLTYSVNIIQEYNQIINKLPDRIDFDPVTPIEIKNIITKLPNNKIPGRDGIRLCLHYNI